jgi:beta-glucosidase
MVLNCDQRPLCGALILIAKYGEAEMIAAMKQSRDVDTGCIFRLGIRSLVCTLLSCTFTASAQAPIADSPAIEAKAHAMLAKLTLKQKIELLGGVDDGNFTHPEPAIGLPALKMSDGPVGIRAWGPDTAYAAGVALAATWDTETARKVGEGLGKDARARNVYFMFGPGVNIARSPLAGRNFEYLSEDPFLNAAMAVPYIEGVQSQGVVATAKHYALNNQEYNRHNVSVDIDERTMREIYLPTFEAAVTKAHVDCIMNSYNLVNGVHATQNEFLNLKVLKGDWGFQGILMSDWDSTYDAVGAANAGLDQEMPRAKFMNAQNLLAAVASGAVKESTLDDKIVRLLRVVLRYGFLDRPQFVPTDSTYSVADRAIALEGARESITLLKNDGHLLPLDPARIKTVAVIGPDSYPAVPGGGGSAKTDAFEPVSTLTGIANLLGPNVHVLYSRGLPEANEVFSRTRWEGDVKVETFHNKGLSGAPEVETSPEIAGWALGMWDSEGQHPRSVRYTAAFKAEKSGRYLLLAAASGEDAYRVFVDGKLLLAVPQSEGQSPVSSTIELSAGQRVNLVAEYVPDSSRVRFGLGIAYEPDLVEAEAKQFAAAADAVIVAVGFNPILEGEGHDRTFTLPWGQDQLIEAVVAANPHTIVTLTGGGGMDTRRWIDKVPALLHTYYPGQEGGTAIAEILFGQRNPEGKLPVTFDRSWDESASSAHYYPIKGADTTLHVTETGGRTVDYVIPHVKYDDKLMVGYRYWTTTGQHPLFPFGFGLSYTTFSFSHLEVPVTAAAGSTVPVSFDVTNTGDVAGAEVAQVYVSDPSAKVDRPERELKGFDKVRLAPGETKHVTLHLNSRSFSYWDEATHGWHIDPGKFIIRLGDSSENTRLHADLTLN